MMTPEDLEKHKQNRVDEFIYELISQYSKQLIDGNPDDYGAYSVRSITSPNFTAKEKQQVVLAIEQKFTKAGWRYIQEASSFFSYKLKPFDKK